MGAALIWALLGLLVSSALRTCTTRQKSSMRIHWGASTCFCWGRLFSLIWCRALSDNFISMLYASNTRLLFNNCQDHHHQGERCLAPGSSILARESVGHGAKAGTG